MAGVDHIGIGSDFDGIGRYVTVICCNSNWPCIQSRLKGSHLISHAVLIAWTEQSFVLSQFLCGSTVLYRGQL